MTDISWTYVLILIFCLVAADKILTVINIKSVEKNFPNVYRYSIEKNPIAKSCFKQYGLAWGTVLYGLLSVFTFLVAFLLLRWCISLFNVATAGSIALWILIIWYCIVIGNNLFFLLKFNKIVP